MGAAMNGRGDQAVAKRGWVVVAVTAVAVIGLVVGVWFATSGSSDPTAGNGSTPSPTETTSASGEGPATAFALFPGDQDLPADTTRSSTVDVEAAWPVPTCEPVAADAGRVDFVSGIERGPEYSRDLAVGWYDGEASATSAYEELWARIQACAASAGASVESAPAELGSAGLVATVAQPSGGGASDVAIYALTRAGDVIAMTVDHASFFDGTVPAPTAATVTLDQAERLVTELCQDVPARC
jgi:hypothetical protein